ncbi:MAG: DUF1800 domain-containing protein [Anaerolineae bacterium]|nr:DUF1800 domain-containing protein [Anaerolineae bacterium]
MSLSRRDFLKLGSTIAGSAVLSACGPVYDWLDGDQTAGPNSILPEADFRLLNRMTYGPTVSTRQQFAQLGMGNWIEEQLQPESIENFTCTLRLRNLSTLEKSASDLFDQSNQLFDSLDKQTVPGELRQATLLRQVYSQRQFFEIMVEFWNDHFNITTEKGACFYLKTVDDREVSRAHAFGSFGDLLSASAHSPAMLVYLDNQANQRGAPNENYARELMELHSLGVDAGYTQKDVMELARCLTGWSVKEHFWRGEFTFDEDMHDIGSKTVLGMHINSAGQSEAESVIELLGRHPSTARFVATKLTRRFIADDVPADLVDKAATAFEQTGGDIPSVLRLILLDGLPHMQPKYKRPVNFVTSALRLLEAETDGGDPMQHYLLRMGQRYFGWPTPDGYPDTNTPWQATLLPRWLFAFALVRNEIPGTDLDLVDLVERAGAHTLPEAINQISALLLGTPLPAIERDKLIASLTEFNASDEEMLTVITGGILASPAFQWR